MHRIRKLAGALLLGVAAAGLSACATGVDTRVSRYQAMPAPAGQTFSVVPADGATASPEFTRHAELVARHLQARGYTPAGAPQVATMLVKLDYGVDEGRTEVARDPFARSRYGYGRFGDPFYGPHYRDPFYGRFGYADPFYDPFWAPYYGRPFYSRYGGYHGRRSPFYYGWDDPFWYYSPYAGYGADYRDGVRSYTVYTGHLDLDIVRRADNAPLFDGHAKARSQTDETSVLVPNLIEAMFTGFPGKSGETIRITVPARKK